MNVVFLSNYFNHHQKSFSDAMYQKIGVWYRFIETATMGEERKKIGYGMQQYPSYVIRYEWFCNNTEQCIELINQADVVIVGSAPEHLISERIAKNKLLFRYSERPFKKGLELWKYPIRYLRMKKLFPANQNVYMLCSSAFTAGDYSLYGRFKNRCLKWGYFPETKIYPDIADVIENKEINSILWVGRMIDWKHPEYAIEVAKRLKQAGCSFAMRIIGTGAMENQLQERIIAEKLEDCVFMPGSCKPEEVRQRMEDSEVFLFTSDRNEGWGAVLNESMNSGCAVVASHIIGSVPFLVRDGDNGLIYKDGCVDDLYRKVKWLLDNPTERKRISEKAYLTMAQEWNAETAAERFLAVAEAALQNKDIITLFKSGVCSFADALKDNWYSRK